MRSDRKLTPEQMAAVRLRARDPKLSILGVICMPMTVAQISRNSGVALGDCGRILGELVRAGKVIETKERGTTAGTLFYDRVLEPP